MPFRLPTKTNKNIDNFEQILTRGFSCVNTRLAFDAEVLKAALAKNHVAKAHDVLSKYLNDRVCNRLKLDENQNCVTRRVICKILKLDESNQ